MFTRDEVLAAAEIRGELQPVRERIREGLLAEARADSDGVTFDDLQVELNEYRHEHKLITADDTDRFLEAYELTLDDLCAYLTRTHWREQLEDVTTSTTIEHEAVETRLWAEVVFDGTFDRATRALAERVSIRLRCGDLATVEDDERQDLLKSLGATREELVKRLAPLGCADRWLDEVIDLEVVQGRELESLLTDRKRESILVARRLDLMRVEVDIGYLDSLDAAREAYMCVAHDGDDLAEVLEIACAEGETVVAFIDDLPPPLSQPLLSAKEGETLQPVEWEGAYVLCRLHEKVAPDLELPEVREKVDEILLEVEIGAVINDHVTYLLPGVGE